MYNKWINRHDLRTINSLISRHNLPQLWNAYKYTFSKKKEYITYDPIELGLYVTDNCTLMCNMCVNHARNKPLDYPYSHQPCKDMSFDTAKKVIDTFNNALHLSLAGVGEPFLNEDIFDMIKYGNMCDMVVNVITNATILHDKIYRIIQSPLSSIEISVDAHNTSEYYNMRGASKQIFDTVLENITKLVENRNKGDKKLRIGLSYVCTKSNYKYLSDMVKLADDLGVDNLAFQNLIPSSMQGFTVDQCLYDDDSDVCEVISSVNESKSKLVVYLPTLLQRTVTERSCKSHFRNIYVDAKGNVSGCARVMSPNGEYGNVFKEENVWNNSYFMRMRRMFHDDSLPLLECCKTCVNNFKYLPIILRKSK